MNRHDRRVSDASVRKTGTVRLTSVATPLYGRTCIVTA